MSLTGSPPPNDTRAQAQEKNDHVLDNSLRTDQKNSLTHRLGSTVLHIRVHHTGQHTDYFVHQDLLVFRSVFFNTATSAPWTNSGFRIVDIQDVHAQTFETYVNLVYTRKLAVKGPQEWQRLCRLYVLAERLQDIETKNLVIDGMFLYLQETVPLFSSTVIAKDRANVDTNSLNLLYEHTPENSPARRLAVDFYAQSGRAEWLQSSKREYPEEFVFDVAIRLMQKRSIFASASNNLSPSSYHEVAAGTGNVAETAQKAGA